MNSEQPDLTRDVIFELLSSDRRRSLIYFLETQDGEADLSELSVLIAAWETETDPADIDEQARNRVYISLYQTHIPKLEDYGLIEYDSENRIVSGTGDLADVIAVVDSSDPTPNTSSAIRGVYSGLAVVLFGLLVMQWVGYDILSVSGIAVAGAVALAGGATAHLYCYHLDSKSIRPDQLLS